MKYNKDYEFKFIVDGSYQISSHYDMFDSDERGLVNVFEIK